MKVRQTNFLFGTICGLRKWVFSKSFKSNKDIFYTDRKKSQIRDTVIFEADKSKKWIVRMKFDVVFVADGKLKLILKKKNQISYKNTWE